MAEPQSVLTEACRAVAGELATPAITADFYLAGGTGLALRLGHRESADFDWFSETNRLEAADRRRLLQALRAIDGDLAVSKELDGTLIVEVKGVSVSLFAYDYPRLQATSLIAGLPVASLPDIASMKLAAIIGRGGRKDFVDIFFLMRRRPLGEWLDMAAKRFADMRDFRALALRALVYFDDADKEPAPRTLVPVAWDDIKTTIRDEVARLSRRYYGLEGAV